MIIIMCSFIRGNSNVLAKANKLSLPTRVYGTPLQSCQTLFYNNHTEKQKQSNAETSVVPAWTYIGIVGVVTP